jgi:ComF family protein
MRKFLARLLFGGSCYVCRDAARELLCTACAAELPRLSDVRCPRCALASPGGAVCGRCLADPPHYDATVAALAYAFPADALVHALKFRGELALAPFLGDMLLQKVKNEPVDMLLAVPLSARRLRERGYNQAVEIARALGREIDLSLCVREGEGRPQMELPYAERRKNIRGAFRCTRHLIGGTVAVVDDVMTTGATLNEVAATLKKAGATRVVNWVVARTEPPS